MKNQSRIVLRVEVRPSCKPELERLNEMLGMKQVAIMSRLVEWFVEQPELIQAAILGRYPKEIEAELAAMLLRRMGDSEPPKRT